jgi:hypothetical protein
MKRSLVALLVLLTAASFASADYVLLMVNLSGRDLASRVGPGPQPGVGIGGGVAGAGAAGAGGIRPGAAAGGIGGMPPVGVGGNPNPRPTPPPTGTPDRDDSVMAIAVVVEVETIGFGDTIKKFENHQKIRVRHPWGGEATLYPESAIGKVELLKDGSNRPIPSVHRRFESEMKRVFNSNGTPEVDEVRKLASWCLTHGLVKEFTEVMEKLVEMDRKLPECAGYLEVREALKRQPDAATVPDWVSKLVPNNRTEERPGYHYQIIHSVEVKDQAKAALEAMERSLLGFYYWWSFHGKAGQLPQVPRQVQLVLMADQKDDFMRFSRIMTPASVVADAFFARREGVIVMAKDRLDERYDAMEKFADRWYGNGLGLTRAEVLRGKPPASKLDAAEVPDAQLGTLVLKALEKERELTAATHDGARQLLYTSGLLTKNVVPPEWLLFGMASFFETSQESPWPGIGAPSYYWLPQFKDNKSTWFERSPGATLRMVVTDSYFRNVPPAGTAGSAARREHETRLKAARTSAWGLAYFLANRKLEGLQRYFKEVNKLPRDMEIDDATLFLCFARAFDAVDANGRPDDAKLTALADEWYKYLANTQLESQELDRQIRQYKLHIQLANTRETGTDSKPGGRPGGGGGGDRPGGGD